MKASEVFTPGRFPTVTYVGEHLVEKQDQLEITLDAGSILVTISGPSKSGKTVFIERCVGRNNLIHVTGAGVNSPADLWMRVFDIIGTPISRTATSSSAVSGTVSGKGKISANVIVKKGEAELGGSASYSRTSGASEEHSVDLLQLLIAELSGTEMVVFIDDFHYIPKDIQVIISEQIKEAIRQNIRIVCASVPYHSDDVLISNADVRGGGYLI